VLSRGNGVVTVGLPATTNVLPHGPYLLFANRSTTSDLSGRDATKLLPSKGLQVFVQGTSVPTVVTPASSAARAKAVTSAKAASHATPQVQQRRVAVATLPGTTDTAPVLVPAATSAAGRREALDLGLLLLGGGTALWLRRRRTRFA
jgi:hypothetical protein